jgi:hypothetical protein
LQRIHLDKFSQRLLNSPLARAQAADFAQRLLRECTESRQCIERAWELAFSRPASVPEAARCLDYLRPRSDQEVPEAALTGLCLALSNTNEFTYLD